MKIVGTCNYDNHSWNFELEDTCYGYVNFVTELSFSDGYNDFKYQFKNMNEFQEQYNKQEKSLFKEFFNDTTIEYNSLNFDFGDWDLINIFEKTEQLNPFVYNYIQEHIEDWYWCLTDFIQVELENVDQQYKKFSYYLSDLIWYATKEVSNISILEIFGFMFCNGMDRYTIDDIKAMDKEGTLKIIKDNIGFDERDTKYIDFALSY